MLTRSSPLPASAIAATPEARLRRTLSLMYALNWHADAASPGPDVVLRLERRPLRVVSDLDRGLIWPLGSRAARTGRWLGRRRETFRNYTSAPSARSAVQYRSPRWCRGCLPPSSLCVANRLGTSARRETAINYRAELPAESGECQGSLHGCASWCCVDHLHQPHKPPAWLSRVSTCNRA